MAFLSNKESQEKNPFELGGENQKFELFKCKSKETLQGNNYSVLNWYNSFRISFERR